MKTLLKKIKGKVLSKKELLEIKGGYWSDIEISCIDGTTRSCSGSSCSGADGYSGSVGWCQCGNNMESGAVCPTQ